MTAPGPPGPVSPAGPVSSAASVSSAGAAAAELVALLTERRQSVAVAESLTGGLLAAALAGVPGASVVFRGGIVAYATDLKAALLGVDQAVLDSCGAVSAEAAQAMAEGVRSRLGATFGVATTGVAGPDPAEGKPVGTVYIAATWGDSSAAAGQTGEHEGQIGSDHDRAGTSAVRALRTRVRRLALAGSRNDIRGETVIEALALLLVMMREETR